MTNVINEHAKPPAYSGAEKGMEQIMKTVTIYNIDKTRSTQVRAAIRVQFDLPKGAIYEKESSASAREPKRQRRPRRDMRKNRDVLCGE